MLKEVEQEFLKNLEDNGFSKSIEFDSFDKAFHFFNYIRVIVGRPRKFDWLKTLEDQSINLVESIDATPTKFGDIWHQDHAYESVPPRYTILVSEVVPLSGGETRFVCRRKLCDSLEPTTKQQLCAESFKISPPANAVKNAISRGVNLQSRASKGIVSRDGHEVVEISPYHTPVEDAETLVEQIQKLYSQYDALSVAVTWRPNMVVIWDNYRVFHKAINNYGSQHRRMFRSVIDR